MKYRTLALLLAGLMLTGCAAQTAGTPVPTTAQTTTAPTITTTLPIGTTTADTVVTDAPITTDTPAISIAPTTTPLVPTTSGIDAPTTTDAPATTDEIVVTTTADAPSTTIDTPATTDTPVTDALIGTTDAPIGTTDAPVTTTRKPITTTKTPATTPTKPTTTTTAKPVTTVKPVTTTAKPVTTPKPVTTTAKPVTTPKPVTTTTKPVTTTTAPVTTAPTVTTAPHTHSYGAWVLQDDYINETRTCSCGASETQVHYATPEDARLIADRVIYYVNKYRAEEGTVTATKLDRLTLVAEMRSEQLTTNYAHDTEDLRECAAYYKYGEYIETEKIVYDPETDDLIFTGEIIKYYELPVGEAINACYGYKNQTIDFIAKETVDSFRNSSGHWRYVGGTSPYIAVGMAYCASNEYEGVTYGNNWFCALFVCSTTEYE